MSGGGGMNSVPKPVFRIRNGLERLAVHLLSRYENGIVFLRQVGGGFLERRVTFERFFVRPRTVHVRDVGLFGKIRIARLGFGRIDNQQNTICAAWRGGGGDNVADCRACLAVRLRLVSLQRKRLKAQRKENAQ